MTCYLATFLLLVPRNKLPRLKTIVLISLKFEQKKRKGPKYRCSGERAEHSSSFVSFVLVFHSTSDANSAISNSGKLKSLINQKVFIKPDKSKSENAEFKRVGDKKKELLEKYPNVEGEHPRVILKKGVLTLDGVEVTRYTPIQTLF